MFWREEFDAEMLYRGTSTIVCHATAESLENFDGQTRRNRWRMIDGQARRSVQWSMECVTHGSDRHRAPPHSSSSSSGSSRASRVTTQTQHHEEEGAAAARRSIHYRHRHQHPGIQRRRSAQHSNSSNRRNSNWGSSSHCLILYYSCNRIIITLEPRYLY